MTDLLDYFKEIVEIRQRQYERLADLAVDGSVSQQDVDEAKIALLQAQIEMASRSSLMKHEDLKKIGIPDDVIAAAKQVGMDAETLGKLVVTHSVAAAKDFLTWLQSKLP